MFAVNYDVMTKYRSNNRKSNHRITGNDVMYASFFYNLSDYYFPFLCSLCHWIYSYFFMAMCVVYGNVIKFTRRTFCGTTHLFNGEKLFNSLLIHSSVCVRRSIDTVQSVLNCKENCTHRFEHVRAKIIVVDGCNYRLFLLNVLPALTHHLC